jgi:hypothetical protein
MSTANGFVSASGYLRISCQLAELWSVACDITPRPAFRTHYEISTSAVRSPVRMRDMQSSVGSGAGVKFRAGPAASDAICPIWFGPHRSRFDFMTSGDISGRSDAPKLRAYFTKQPKSLKRLRRHRGFHFEAFEGLDHALLNGEPRRLAGNNTLALLEPGSYSRRAAQR